MNELPYSPWDLLPINNPKDEQPDKDYFYNNVVKYLIPDIVEMEANGIPISLDKVAELDEIVSKTLEEVKERLKNNPLVIKFLESKYIKVKKQKIENIKQKKKEITDFIVEFNIKNKIHRSYVINTYLDSIENSHMKMDEWSIKDTKKLNQIIASKFISDLLDSKEFKDNYHINEGMKKLASNKCEAYNKNKIEKKIETVQQEKSLPEFNPSSSSQLGEFFKFYEIESENITPAENPKWDRQELERVQRMLKIEIERKEILKENNNE